MPMPSHIRQRRRRRVSRITLFPTHPCAGPVNQRHHRQQWQHDEIQDQAFAQNGKVETVQPSCNYRNPRPLRSNARTSWAVPASTYSNVRSPSVSSACQTGKSDPTSAGFLARGSSLDVRPSQALHDLVPGGAGCPGAPVHRAHRVQLQGQARIGMASRRAWPSAPHSLLKSLSGHRRDLMQSRFQRSAPGGI